MSYLYDYNNKRIIKKNIINAIKFFSGNDKLTIENKYSSKNLNKFHYNLYYSNYLKIDDKLFHYLVNFNSIYTKFINMINNLGKTNRNNINFKIIKKSQYILFHEILSTLDVLVNNIFNIISQNKKTIYFIIFVEPIDEYKKMFTYKYILKKICINYEKINEIINSVDIL